MRTFVVGDIHGHASKLRKLLPKLHERAEEGDTLIFIGDFIDRGPDSRGVIDLVIEQSLGGWNGPVVGIRGNHEILMLDSLERRPRYGFDAWMQNGGLETIGSYTGGRVTRTWLEAVPASHIEFLHNLKDWHEDEHGIYVHAGLKPGLQPAECDEDSWQWIRSEFIESDYAWEKVVVFGHTPQYGESDRPIMDPRDLPWRPLDKPEKIGIDTGAAYGGFLSAVALPDREFFSVK
ncbi:MAG: metallophosphoesterase [Armatimonadetes bacterium]|nr:metallophosphoesterase [Armatimonadota bacterium]